MILFALEYYVRKVWSLKYETPISVEWNDSTLLQTLNLLRFHLRNRKWLIRFRFWEDRYRLGFELKYSVLEWNEDRAKQNLQWKLGFYVFCSPRLWNHYKYFLSILGWKTKTKLRQSIVYQNLRITLDDKKKIEIKFHQTPII